MIKSHHNFDLSAHNTFAMKVKCGCFMEYDSASDIPFIMSSIRKGIDFMHIGAGSNILFTSDYPGIVLHSAIKEINEVERTGNEVLIEAGSGVVMDHLIALTCDRGLWGLENLSGIPGEVGASAVQNVGAYGVEAADVIECVKAFDTVTSEFVTIPVADCSYGYRDSIFKHSNCKGRYIVHAVIFRLSSAPRPVTSYPALRDRFATPPSSPLEVRRAVTEIRDTKLPDPAVVPSAGSFFKNPVISREQFDKLASSPECADIPHYDTDGGVKIPAAWLIDRCGWKGYSDGSKVAVWHLQPLVIVNPCREATPSDVINLKDRIIASVKERFGITLVPEVEHI